MIETLEQQDLAQFSVLLASAGLPVEDIHQAQWFALLGYYQQDRMVAAAGLEDFAAFSSDRGLFSQQRHRGRTGLHAAPARRSRKEASLLAADHRRRAIFFKAPRLRGDRSG